MIFLQKEWHDAVNLSAQTGERIHARTDVSLTVENDTVFIRFHCQDNPHLEFNQYTQDNEPLYNQEVFELFISGGADVSDHYLEIELNPNGALWAGLIRNPGMGLQGQPLHTTYLSRSEHQIITSVWTKVDAWGGTIEFPVSLIPGYPASAFRFNLYRILAKTKPLHRQWICSPENAYFLCLHPTLSGDQPAFHRPLAFGLLP